MNSFPGSSLPNKSKNYQITWQALSLVAQIKSLEVLQIKTEQGKAAFYDCAPQTLKDFQDTGIVRPFQALGKGTTCWNL